MNTSVRVLVTFGILIVLIAGLYVFSDWFSKTTGYFSGEEQELQFVGCLEDHGAVLYLKEDCSACLRQERVFTPKALELISTVSCDQVSCGNLPELPAWEIDGQFYYGEKDFKQLSQISSCEIDETALSG